MNLEKRDKILIVVVVIVCIALACLSPFIASSNPDGLEKTAEDANVPEGVEGAVISSPMPDYSFEPLGKIGEMGALIIGTIIVLLIGFGAGYILKKKNQ